MQSVSCKLLPKSSVTTRSLWLLNRIHNGRAIKATLSSCVVRHNQSCTWNYSSLLRMSRCTLGYFAARNRRLFSAAQGSGNNVNAVGESGMSANSLIEKIIGGLRIIAAPLVKKTVLIGSSKNVYQCCVDGMNFEDFFEACDLPDTFQSWFIVLHLHIWMCLVRLKAEGADGRFMYKKLVEMMWFDVEERMKNLGTIDSVVVRDNLRVLVKQFYGLTIALDEGLLCDDTVLATALWRNMFYNKKSTDAEALGRLVEYVRKNVQHLESLSADDLLYGDANFSWLPFKEEQKETDAEMTDTVI